MLIKIKNRQITDFNDNVMVEVGDRFLYENNTLTSFSAPSLVEIGNCFLYNNPENKIVNLINN